MSINIRKSLEARLLMLDALSNEYNAAMRTLSNHLGNDAKNRLNRLVLLKNEFDNSDQILLLQEIRKLQKAGELLLQPTAEHIPTLEAELPGLLEDLKRSKERGEFTNASVTELTVEGLTTFGVNK